MKHLKLFETQSVQSMKNIVEEFNKLTELVKPIVIEKFKELAEDEDYEAEYGDSPNQADLDMLILNEVNVSIDYFNFYLQEYNNNGEVVANYTITMSDEELETKLNSKKYNL